MSTLDQPDGAYAAHSAGSNMACDSGEFSGVEGFGVDAEGVGAESVGAESSSAEVACANGAGNAGPGAATAGAYGARPNRVSTSGTGPKIADTDGVERSKASSACRNFPVPSACRPSAGAATRRLQ